MKRKAIVIHHSAGKDGIAKDWDGIIDYHLSKGWRDVGYNYGIEFVGGVPAVFNGRPLNIAGAHCPAGNMNREGIGICVVGNFELAPPSPLLIDALTKLCKRLCAEHNIVPEMILPHRQFKATLCPGRYFPMKYLADLVNTNLYADTGRA